jgi:serine/threonine protein kinase
MLRKVRLLGSVVHTSIGRILDYGWHADRLWYATPWYEGHTLEQLAQQGPLSPSEAIDIFAPLARALSALHEHGVVHRAITSSNTLILRIGTKKTYETLPLLTGYDTWLLGDVSVPDEPRSLAPEVAKRLSQGAHSGSPTPDEDVFALGLALLHSLEPRARPRGDDPWPAFLARRAKSPIEVSDSPKLAPFAKLLRQALSINADARPSAAEFAAALEGARREVAEKRARRRLLVPISVVAVAVVLLLITYFVRQSRLRLIDATLDAADAQVLDEELEAERARALELESQLSRQNQPEP